MTNTRKKHSGTDIKTATKHLFADAAGDTESEMPAYLKKLYRLPYLSKKFSELIDGEYMAQFQTFFFADRLTKSVTNEIREDQSVLQLGVASGNFERKVAEKMKSTGLYRIEDLSLVRLDACRKKLAPWTNVILDHQDVCVLTKNPRRYDVVICCFMLHELPDGRKRKLLKKAFDSLLPNGCVIFVDYNKPHPFNPLGFFVKRFNRVCEPFAESLFRHEIRSFADDAAPSLIWDKKTFCGGLYQCVIAQRR